MLLYLPINVKVSRGRGNYYADELPAPSVYGNIINMINEIRAVSRYPSSSGHLLEGVPRRCLCRSTEHRAV